ncbi:MAG TPA: hypothetical protein VFQ05_08875 [Candidatus Eisenbacteria bacterium]|nr:hypothetical protein [Candidatus Eisenbacteria bacterium]
MKHARLSRTSAPRVFAAVAALVLLSALAACTMVGERMTGVRLDDGPTSCVKDCNDFYKGEYDREQKLHLSNVEACQVLEQPAKVECLESEAARHEAAMVSLSAGKTECQNTCHRQGAGTAG